ncbi:MAG: beta-N-acetylhexosaminidase [Cryobacterium sp.]|nr:beta-N-acetylhexosaminidase [Cryobacterium sp.]
MALIHRVPWYALLAIVLAGASAANSAVTTPTTAGAPPAPATATTEERTVVPSPVFRVAGKGTFTLDGDDSVDARDDAAPVAEYLVNWLRPMTGLSLPLSGRGNIVLVVEPGHPPGGYDLRVTSTGIWIAANDGAGLFAGVQTLRQLLPPKTDATSHYSVAATTISDYPRFAYRGAMLDVARHFFPVSVVKRYIDDIALLKMNVLHLHLADDQGWRIAINGWPRLTQVGGAGEVGSARGGFYTQSQFKEIVAYAASRYITIVPEIDMPGHTNAALASYAELNCDGIARTPYHGTSVGFSSLCVDKPITWTFVTDVIDQLAALTPGPWLHVGGDESTATSLNDYLRFVRRVGQIVAATGKTMIGWHDIGRNSNLPEGTIGEYWDFTTPRPGSATFSRTLVKRGGQLIMAPANVAYLDQKYSLSETLGTQWAQAPLTIQEAYGWDPAKVIKNVGDDQILGVEAPLWSETFSTRADLEYLAFPRIAAIAEVGWMPQDARHFKDFAVRLASFGVYLDSLGINYKRTPGVPWQKASP